MIGTIRSMSKNQKDVVVDVAVFVACAAFLAGWLGCIFAHKEPVEAYLTMPRDDRAAMVMYLNAQNEIPAEATRAIAEDYCAASKSARRVCLNARKYVDPISGKPVSGIIEGE